MYNAQIAQRIKSECKKKELPISKMLEDCGMSKSLIYDLEKRGAVPSVAKLSKIAQYLGTTSTYLLGETDDPTPLSTKKTTPQSGERFDDESLELAREIMGLSVEDKARVLDYLALLKKQDNA